MATDKDKLAKELKHLEKLKANADKTKASNTAVSKALKDFSKEIGEAITQVKTVTGSSSIQSKSTKDAKSAKRGEATYRKQEAARLAKSKAKSKIKAASNKRGDEAYAKFLTGDATKSFSEHLSGLLKLAKTAPGDKVDSLVAKARSKSSDISSMLTKLKGSLNEAMSDASQELDDIAYDVGLKGDPLSDALKEVFNSAELDKPLKAELKKLAISKKGASKVDVVGALYVALLQKKSNAAKKAAGILMKGMKTASTESIVKKAGKAKSSTGRTLNNISKEVKTTSRQVAYKAKKLVKGVMRYFY